MTKILYPNDYIENVLINEVGDISRNHPYISFSLMCTGIEFLGICIDDNCEWFDRGLSKKHFIEAIEILFPTHYKKHALALYEGLRCGLLHSQLPNGYSLTELKHDVNNSLSYESHLINNDQLIVVEHFYRDFATACNQVIKTQFNENSKMNKPLLKIG